MSDPVQRRYHLQYELKYGCNPQQKPAGVYTLEGAGMPFETLNGRPGYINLLDALNAWQLVRELDEALGLPAAASFKHVSPAGAAVAAPLDDTLRRVYECGPGPLTPLAQAYLRARGADPMSSFGDFIALSRPVDAATAAVIKSVVSDGVVAPGYEPEALEALKAKKGGGYLILKADPGYRAPEVEFREVFGLGLAQRRNDETITADALLANVVTRAKGLPENARRDLVLAAITLKYTQSNSVGYALDGQMIGIGAGQQSRVDCTKLAGRKAEIWHLRRHPKVLGLPFRPELKAVDRTNARVRFIEDDLTPKEVEAFRAQFTQPPAPLTPDERAEWLAALTGVSLASDAFLPFRDNIDQASKRGVSYITQPGGSVRDDLVVEAADEYGMVMAFSNLRLFHH